jgi:hypothetical protein
MYGNLKLTFLRILFAISLIIGFNLFGIIGVIIIGIIGYYILSVILDENKDKIEIKKEKTHSKKINNDKDYSNYVSESKFIFLSIITFGIYELIWAYRSWKYIKEKENLDIMPFWRTFFFPFFMYGLSKKILSYAKKEKYKHNYSPATITFFWIFIYLFSRAESFLFYISFLTFIPLLFPLNASNYYWGKNSNNSVVRKMNVWQIILMVIYVIIITFTFIDTTENPRLYELENEIAKLETEYNNYNCTDEYLDENYENCLYLQDSINPLIEEYNLILNISK